MTLTTMSQYFEGAVMTFVPENTNTGPTVRYGAFRGCNAPMRYEGALSRALLGFARADATTSKTKLVFHGGRVHRVYLSEHRTRWGVKYNRLLQLTRRLHK